MTKPKNFIFNSDYLALAQARKNSLEFNIDSKSMIAYSSSIDGKNAHVPPEPGAIDRFYLSTDGDKWTASSHLRKIFDNNTDLMILIIVNRTNKDRIRIRLEYTNQTSNNYTFPAFTLYVRVDSFKPPNVL